MAYQTITVRPDHGDPFVLKIEARDALMWEQTGRDNPSILHYLVQPSMVEMYRLAHCAMKRQHQYDGSLSDFQRDHELSIGGDDEEEDDEGPDPTESAPSADDSSSSRSRPASRPASGRTRASKRSSPRSS